MSSDTVNINITSGSIIRVMLYILLFFFLYLLRDLLLVILTSVVVASSIEPFIKKMENFKVPRVLSAIAVYLSIAVVLAGFFFLFVPPLLDETSSFLSNSPQYLKSLDTWNTVKNGGVLSSSFMNGSSGNFPVSEVINEIRLIASGATEGFFKMISTFFGGITSLILITIFSFYLAVQKDGIINFLKIVTPIEHEEYIIDLWKRSQAKIGLWMQGQLLLAVLIGVLVYLGLTIIGIKYAFLLALLAAITELIPIFGPVIAAIPGVAIGFTTGGTSLGLLVLGFYVIIQQFENHLIYPLVVKKVVGVNPLIVIIALIIGMKLAGFLGVILSVPVATALMELVEDRERRKRMASS